MNLSFMITHNLSLLVVVVVAVVVLRHGVQYIFLTFFSKINNCNEGIAIIPVAFLKQFGVFQSRDSMISSWNFV